MDECTYFQYLDNGDFYCTLYSDSGFVHPECACYGCSDYNGDPVYLRSAEKTEEE